VTTSDEAPDRSRNPFRTAIVRLTILSFSVAALLGIIALLAGGSFGDTEVRILLTTLLVGTVSIAMLCYLSTAGTACQVVGVLGGVAVLAPLVTSLIMIWSEDWPGSDELLLKTFGVGTVVAGTLAQASLLLSLGRRARGVVRGLLLATLLLAVALAGMISALILGYVPDDDETYARVLGVVAILDVLGTVVVSALSKFGPTAARGSLEVALSGELAARVDAEAARTGQSRDAVVATAVARYLDAGARDV
jgi:MFS family permease